MFKSFMNSMTVRFFLILLGGTIVSAAIVLMLAAYEGRDMLAQIRTRHLNERIEQIILTLEATPAASREKIAAITEKSGVRIDFSPLTALSGHTADAELTAALTRTLGSNRKITSFQRYSTDCPTRPDMHGTKASDVDQNADSPHDCRTVLATLLDGTAVRIDIASPPDRMPVPFRPNFLPYLLLFLSCVAGLGFFVAHLATKPLRRLAQAAHDLGQNLEQPRLPEDQGPTEVREAAGAFNSMQSRIRHFIEERTYMLAAIAHDLQTPLTRLRLRLEKVSDEDLRTKLVNDLAVTQDMVKEGLELARSLNAEEPFELLDMDSLIDTICNDATDAGLEVTHSGKVGTPVMGRPNALRRCLANLVDNAVKYGGFAHIIVKKEGQKVIVSIIDGGPGIPEHELKTVLQPFKRLEGSRSRDSGGTGLGLTIAYTIAEKHRGTLRLRNICAGGLGLEAILEMSIS
jgi:signal transduction histidine kinase